jgi:hypothetical protein
MKIINLTAIKEKYQVECLSYKSICSSACVVKGTYSPDVVEDEEQAKEEIHTLLSGTFGGYWTKFKDGEFIYTQCTD